MNYEKKYNDALEKARIAYNKITPENTAVKKLLEESFPELRESEDERIRKEIVSALKFANDGGVYDKHIAYLEKQKECLTDNSKTSESEDERIRRELVEYLKGDLDDITTDDTDMWIKWIEKQKEQKINTEGDFGRGYDCGYQAGYAVAMNEMKPKVATATLDSEKQKEQKPESLIYDKDLDKAAREFYLSGGADSPVDSTGLVPIVRMAEFGATWMKERMEKEQKPVEIDEDVELGLDRALQIVEEAKGNLQGYQSDDGIYECDHAIGTLKHILKRGIKQKPAECSEEDEKILAELVDALGEKTSPNVCAWLKSLRPSWKPSKQEIDAFETALKGKFQNGVYPAVRLCELFQKLKKLYYNDKISHWKPNEEQVEALELAEKWYSDNIGHNKYLWSLLVDLKKLV